jgi:poly(A) polymerase
MDFGFLGDARVRSLFALWRRAGRDLYVVGGAVRNGILSLPVKDVDFATPVPPNGIVEILESAGIGHVDAGRKFGVITALADGGRFEIASFRRDSYLRPRFPKVRFTDSLEADSRRRDFAMNAMYADAGGGLRDPQGGLADVKEKKIVRFIGSAERSVHDDPLRILRYFRFCCEYFHENFDGPSLDACVAFVRLIGDLPSAKLAYERERLASSPGLGVLRDVWKSRGIGGYMDGFMEGRYGK